MRRWIVGISSFALAMLGASARADLDASATLAEDFSNGGYHYYTITLENTGTTDIGSFWYAWEPDINFMSNYPYISGNPDGWYGYPTGGYYVAGQYDGYGIEWYNVYGNAIPAGSSAQFSFYSYDALDLLTGDSLAHPGTPTGTSYVYIGFPESDAGHSLVVGSAAAPVPEPASLGVLGAGILLSLRRRARRTPCF